jgi:hypothetical protein
MPTAARRFEANPEGHDEAAKEPFYSKNFARLLEPARTGDRIPSLS